MLLVASSQNNPMTLPGEEYQQQEQQERSRCRGSNWKETRSSTVMRLIELFQVSSDASKELTLSKRFRVKRMVFTRRWFKKKHDKRTLPAMTMAIKWQDFAMCCTLLVLLCYLLHKATFLVVEVRSLVATVFRWTLVSKIFLPSSIVSSITSFF
ncbi:hypothetical protein KAFR_0H03450 [Kazachstania africana CBS 2517]|uniref:Uncharacterized protein n=1 Tax=Kazachstania africana (strain ATCC 22294 / BCRC 22015 / CBS 2517 / CECT 1963 / NBRC 1671 / NRRL Y-8276) TaxID=1071382 RepID=H2AYH8_KAZAF|nr:hypothetical protein KAFR_0H03450 [Kazachstania africana CBS 2517]CCF59755.1 hypothetical protein KAFR_0H03450 [Kazachstania africana CBS 2517]